MKTKRTAKFVTDSSFGRKKKQVDVAGLDENIGRRSGPVIILVGDKVFYYNKN